MRIVSIAYGRTLSEKDFGGFRGDCSAEISEGDCLQSCMNEMKKFVLKNLNDDIIKVEDPSQEKMNLDIKEEITKEETPQEEVAQEAPKKKVAKKASKKAKKIAKKAVKKSANVAYDRNLKVHKDMFLNLVTELGIRKEKMSPDEKLSLKETSLFMENQDMFEVGTTEILDLFKHNVESFYKKNLEGRSVDV